MTKVEIYASKPIETEVRDIVTSPLQDGYEAFGVDLEDFKEATSYMSSITHSLVIKDSGMCQVLSVCNEDRFQKKDCYAFYIWNALNISEIPEIFALEKKPLIGYKKIADFPEALYEELFQTSAMAIVHQNKFFIMSDLAIPTFSSRCGVSGDRTINKPSLLRNMHMAEGWFDKVETTNFIYREEEVPCADCKVRMAKIFAALGGRYSSQKQEILNDIIDVIVKEGVLGRMEVRSWHQDHRFTDIYLEFPEAGKDIRDAYALTDDVIPGLYLTTSDVGSSSLICRGVYRLNRCNGHVIVSELKKAHTSSLNPSEFIKDVDRNVFNKIRNLPETLAELFEDVIDYSKVDLTSEKGQQKALCKIEALLKMLSKKCLKPIGQKREQQLVEALVAEINPELHYTYYDISIMLMETPDRVEGLDSFSLAELEKGCGKIPYVAKDIMNGKIKLEEEAIYLAP